MTIYAQIVFLHKDKELIVMQVLKLLHKELENEMIGIHKKRIDSLFDCVQGLINSKVLTLTSIGRSIENQVSSRSNIRKVDRLLSNEHLYNERILFYKYMNKLLLAQNPRPLINVDWSCISSKAARYLLRASIAVKGRSIVVYEEVYKKEQENNHETHKNFLKTLQSVLPDKTIPIIVTDAGFRALWFNAVRKRGWDFIGRIRNKNLINFNDGVGWLQSKDLYEIATNKPKFLGEALLTRKGKMRCNFVVYKGTYKINNDGRSNSSSIKKYRKSHKEPLLLATSLLENSDSARKAVNLYEQRMQIEENFRDTKDRRYGFGLNESGTRTTKRLSILLLIAALSTFLCWIAGIHARLNKYSSNYQAHSAKFTSVLSIVYLGREVIVREPVRLIKKQFFDLIRLLSEMTIFLQGEMV
jgi:hypothetical protein